MPAPTRAQLLERNIALREREDAIRDVLSDDDLDCEDKLDAIDDIVEDGDEEEDGEEGD